MSLKIFFLIGILAAFVAGCSDDPSTGPKDPSVNAILPLAEDNHWILERTRTEQGSVGVFNDTMRVYDNMVIDGQTWHAVGFVHEGSERFMRNATGGLFIYEKNAESLYLPFPAEIGDSTIANTSEGLLTVFVLATDEQVVTPAGTFACYKYYWEEVIGLQYTQYYAPNVGIVKREMEFTYTSPEYPDGYYLKEVSVLLGYELAE